MTAAGLGAAVFASPRQTMSDLGRDGLVRVTIGVERDDGTPVTGLMREDLEVLSDGQTRPIDYFSSEDEPVALVLLLDVTASNPIFGDTLSKAAESVLRERRTPPDRVRVGGLASKLTLSPRFDTEWPDIRRAVRLVWKSPLVDRLGPSPLWDGVEAAVTALEAERGRRAIVMVTDGRATGNVHSWGYAISRAIAADVSIGIVAVTTAMYLKQDKTTAAMVRPYVPLEQMAAATGGSYTQLRATGDLKPFLSRSISRLHELYAIGFPPTAFDGQSHDLVVRVKRPSAKVRARAGYVAAAPRKTPAS
jgi:VWFA-related protein